VTYDQVCDLINMNYEKTGNIGQTVKETGQPFAVVYEALGFKDYDDFVLDTGDKD